MSTTNQMSKTTPRQAVQQIPHQIRNNLTIRNESMTCPYTTNWTNGDWALQNSTQIRRKMYKNDENSFPWQRPLSDSNLILQQSSTPVGTPAGGKLVRFEKNWWDWSRTFSAKRSRRSSTNQKQFWLSGHPRSLWMVPSNRRQNFPCFLSWGVCAYLA